MSSLLRGLIECSRLIVSDKISERKKQIEELRCLLSNEEILDALHKNGNNKERFTWTLLFDAVKICVCKEIDYMEKESRKETTTTLINAIDRKKKSCAGLIKIVISNANSRNELKLKTTNVVNHLLMVMKREFAWNLFTVEYSNILLKEVLAQRRIARDIPPADLEEFILVYTEFYMKSKSIAQHDLVMQILAAIINLGYYQTMLDASLIFSFFKDIIEKNGSQLKISQTENMMFTCLTFCKAVAVNCRLQLCYFGECVLDSVLSMLEDNISNNFKTVIYDFLHLQVVCHHPRGACFEDEGFMSCDSKLWQKHLHRLYLTLLKDLQNPPFRSRHSTKNLGLEPHFLELLVDVFHAEIILRVDIADSNAKRRRLDNGFAFLVDTVQTVGTDTDNVVSWLMLIGGSLRKYPTLTCTPQELVSIVGILHQLQTDCKRYVIMSPLLDCIQSILSAYIQPRFANIFEQAVNTWVKIYEFTVRTVSLNHCIEEGHRLICTFIESKIIRPGPELMCFLTPGIGSLTLCSLKTLSTILTYSSLLKLSGSGGTRFDGFRGCRNVTPLELRLRLLDWLFPNYLEEKSSSIFKRNDVWSIDLHARTLVTLVIPGKLHRIPIVSKSDKTHSLEDIYLQASCVLETEDINVEMNCDKEVNNSDLFHPVKDKLVEYLIRDCSILLDMDFNVESQDVVTISAHCCLVMKCIGHMIQNEILCSGDLFDLRLCDVLEKLMQRMVVWLGDICTQEQNGITKQQIVSQVVSNLCELYSWHGSIDFCQTMSQFCCEITSERLIDVLFECLYGNVFRTTLVSTSDSDSNMDACEEIDDDSTRSKSRFVPLYSYERFFLTDNVTNLVGLFDWPTSDVERLQLSIAHLLAILCENIKSPSLSPLRSETASKLSVADSRLIIQSRILQRLLDETFSIDLPLNVQLVFIVMNEFMKPAHTLDDKFLGDLLQIFRRVCKIHFKDGEISLACLNILSKLLLRLNDYFVKGIEMSLALRDQVFHMLNGFCVCRSRGNTGPYTELGIVNALAALAKCDVRLFLNDNESASKIQQLPTPSVILSFMGSKCFPVSFLSANSVQLLLQNQRSYNNNCDANVYDGVFTSVMESINNATVSLDGSLKQLDQQSNWTSSTIVALKQLVIGSPFCLKKALFAMCIHANKVQTSIPLVKKAMKTISSFYGYPSFTEFIDSQIDYLIYKCFENDNDLIQFIWRLTDNKSLKEFYKKYYHSLVPLAFSMSKWDNFREQISDALERTPVDIVTECFPRIMTFTLPESVDETVGSVTTESRNRSAQMRYDLLETILSKKVVDDQLTSRLNEIIVSLLKLVRLNHVQHNQELALPPGSLPSYGLETIHSFINYILARNNQKNTSLISVLCQTQDGIQKVLLALQMNIDNCHEPHDVYNAFIAYKFFVSLVWKEFNSGLQNNWSFVLHDVVIMLLHLLDRYESDNQELSAVAWECCDLLKDIASSALALCLNEFAKLIPRVVNALIAHVLITAKTTTDTTLCVQAVSIINFLVVDNGDKLKNTLVYLEPFPDLSCFASARDKYIEFKYSNGPLTIKQEIEHFLRGLKLNEGHLRPEGLQFLCRQLTSHQTELKELINELKGLNFTDECSSNLIYVLMVELVHLCSVSKSKSEIVLEAARCLGELGPLPLSSVVLEPNKICDLNLRASMNVFKDDPVSQRHVLIFHKLWTYLSDFSIKVKAVSSLVLKNALSTQSGNAFAKLYKNKKASPLFDYLHPFCSVKTSSTTITRMTDEELRVAVDSISIWSSVEDRYDEYIVRLCCALIDTGVHDCEILHCLQPVCNLKVDFCTELFPFLIHSILSSDNSSADELSSLITRHIDGFFAKFASAYRANPSRSVSSTSSSQSSSSIDCALQPIYLQKRAINVMLNTIQFLRLQMKSPNSRCNASSTCTPYDDNFRLNINYLNVAQAAHFCEAHFSALLFVEIFCEIKSRALYINESQESSSSHFSGSPISILGSNCPNETKAVQDLLLRIYRSIGDPDAIYGCGMAHLSDANVRLQYYEHERRWHRAAFAYDLSMSSDVPSLIGLPRTLQKLGLQHLSHMYLDCICRESQSAEIREFQSECAWKLTRWDDSTSGNWLEEDEKSGFHELLHCSLVAFRQNDHGRFQDLCSRAHKAVVLNLHHEGVECIAGLTHPLTSLYTLNNLRDLSDWDRPDDNFIGNLLSKWSGRDAVVQRDYDVLEPVLSIRIAVLQLLKASHGRKQEQEVLRAIIDCEWRQAELARKNGLLQLAETFISRIRDDNNSMTADGLLSTTKWKLEEAKIFWKREEHDTAKSLLSIFIDELERQNNESSLYYAQALGLYGNWLIETHSDNASNIMRNYLEKSISLLEQRGLTMDTETSESLMNAYVTTARYADSHYQRIVDYLKSSDYESKQQIVNGSKEEVQRLKNSVHLPGDKQRSCVILVRQIEIDNKELEAIREERHRFLLIAARNYAKCLALGTSEDIRVFRLVSLWFHNREVTDMNANIKDLTARVPSHKFLPLIYQLAARMENCSSSFQKILLEMIERMTLDHPHHTLLVILALTNATKDEIYLDVRKKTSSRSKKPEETERAVAAKDLLNRVRKSKRLKLLVSDLEKLCEALIAFSYWKPPGTGKIARGNIAADQPLAKLRRLERVPPLTLRIPVDPTCSYDKVPGILSHKDTFIFCGGVNAPKRISCRDTDGVDHSQLVKGNDDLKQDAVMQQVFTQVNELLSSNPETARRNLTIRTYKVVPLSQRSGVLQWCENTIPLGGYLTDDERRKIKGAHSRYHPDDWKVSICRSEMENVAFAQFDIKYETFLKVCRNLRPVFRHFFLEKFPQASTWYERRMAYVRSVATTSIVGHILGLGDRHVSNILVDTCSAELIHIDFGIAFEQGRNLTFPETVPFRLTRDLVDGMGITGTEGPFRRCCEKTMSLMRSSQEVILTILEVFLYDPLYQWSLTPLKACKIQAAHDRTSTCTDTADVSGINDGDIGFGIDHNVYERPKEEDINKLAERALNRLRQKLQGIENGATLSVSGQVSHLIQEAMDPVNLCKLFKGWQAYL